MHILEKNQWFLEEWTTDRGDKGYKFKMIYIDKNK